MKRFSNESKGMLAGVFLLHESFGWRHLVGVAMILLGLYGVNRAARRG